MIQFHKSVQYLYSNVQFAKRHGQLPVNQNALAICALAVLGIHCSNSAYNEGLYQTSWANGVLGHCLNLLHQHVNINMLKSLHQFCQDIPGTCLLF